MKITIGTNLDGKPVHIDLDTLITTRLLIQANSGAGKSWLLRVLIEQLYGHVQVIVVDPEGEFATLREKFDFVLVGKEGADTPADVRSAELLAHKLLEIRASAVCDLYEMKPSERHKWVELFLDAMINAPKKLWHPCVVVVDEAHMFCPEKGAGESVASEAMISLTTRGRKRGFCAVWATQRLAKLNKDASSVLQNRFVGGTFEDVDIKRALDLLSVEAHDKNKVAQQLKTMDPGWFFGFGRAIAKQRLLFKSGKVQTSHPQPGSSKHAASPPPTPDKIRALLPKLADLPQTAEEKARTVAELTREVRELKRQLNSAQKAQPAAATAKPLKEEVIKREVGRQTRAQLQVISDLRTALEQAMKVIVRISATGFEKSGVVDAEKVKKAVEKVAADIVAITDRALDARNREFEKLKADASAVVKRLKKILDQDEVTVDIDVAPPTPARATPKATPPPKRVQTNAPSNGDAPGDFSAAHVRVLSRLAEIHDATGRDAIPKNQLAAWSDYSPNSGGYNNNLGKLRSAGLIEYPQPGMVALTDAGRALAQPDNTPISTDQMLERAKKILGGSEGRILEVVHGQYPEPIDKIALAEAAGFTPNSGGYNNYLGHMRTLGFIDYADREGRPAKGQVRAADWLFLENAA